MSEDLNAQFVNKYIQILKAKFDGLQNELLNAEVQNSFFRETLTEKDVEIKTLSEKLEQLESLISEKTERVSKSRKEKGE